MDSRLKMLENNQVQNERDLLISEQNIGYPSNSTDTSDSSVVQDVDLVIVFDWQLNQVQRFLDTQGQYRRIRRNNARAITFELGMNLLYQFKHFENIYYAQMLELGIQTSKRNPRYHRRRFVEFIRIMSHFWKRQANFFDKERRKLEGLSVKQNRNVTKKKNRQKKWIKSKEEQRDDYLWWKMNHSPREFPNNATINEQTVLIREGISLIEKFRLFERIYHEIPQIRIEQQVDRHKRRRFVRSICIAASLWMRDEDTIDNEDNRTFVF